MDKKSHVSIKKLLKITPVDYTLRNLLWSFRPENNDRSTVMSNVKSLTMYETVKVVKKKGAIAYENSRAPGLFFTN